jgi:hypothetical protein
LFLKGLNEYGIGRYLEFASPVIGVSCKSCNRCDEVSGFIHMKSIYQLSHYQLPMGTLVNGSSSVVLRLRSELHCSSFQRLLTPKPILLRPLYLFHYNGSTCRKEWHPCVRARNLQRSGLFAVCIQILRRGLSAISFRYYNSITSFVHLFRAV